MSLYNFWPTEVGIRKIPGVEDLNKQLILDCYDIRSNIEEGQRSGIGTWQSQYDVVPTLQERYRSFKSLETIIKKISFQYMIEAGHVVQHIVSGMWVNMNTDNPIGYHIPHIHNGGNFDWTGIYYPCTYGNVTEELNVNISNEPKDGNLILFPSSDGGRGLPITIQPQESLIVLFPLHVMHGVAPKGNSNNNPRISISWDINSTVP